MPYFTVIGAVNSYNHMIPCFPTLIDTNNRATTLGIDDQ